MADEQYSIKLEKLLYDLEERPAKEIFKGLQHWFENPKDFTGQQKEKFDKLVKKWGFNV